MNDFEKRIPEDETMVEDWPDPEDYERKSFNTKNYEVRFKANGLTTEEVNWISRYLFDAISKELEIPYIKLEDLEIEES